MRFRNSLKIMYQQYILLVLLFCLYALLGRINKEGITISYIIEMFIDDSYLFLKQKYLIELFKALVHLIVITLAYSTTFFLLTRRIMEVSEKGLIRIFVAEVKINFIRTFFTVFIFLSTVSIVVDLINFQLFDRVWAPLGPILIYIFNTLKYLLLTYCVYMVNKNGFSIKVLKKFFIKEACLEIAALSIILSSLLILIYYMVEIIIYIVYFQGNQIPSISEAVLINNHLSWRYYINWIVESIMFSLMNINMFLLYNDQNK